MSHKYTWFKRRRDIFRLYGYAGLIRIKRKVRVCKRCGALQ